MKAVLKYPGSKWSLAKWIINFFPDHHSYLEPFFGSGAVLFNKPRSNIETVNDLDGNVVNFFEWIKYLDPPYVLGTRHGKQYRYEMYDEGHKELLDVVLKHKGKILISGYDNELYNSRLQEWHREETISYSQICSKKREILWMNFEPAGRQLSFEDFGGIV